MSFTYAQLKQAIQDYAENDETSFVSNIPIFIRAAEERILKNVQLNFFRKNVIGSMTSSVKFLAAPTDFLSPFSLAFSKTDTGSIAASSRPNTAFTINGNNAVSGAVTFSTARVVTATTLGTNDGTKTVTVTGTDSSATGITETISLLGSISTVPGVKLFKTVTGVTISSQPAANVSIGHVNGEQVFLLFKDVDYVQEYNPDPTTTGAPRYYAQFDVDNFIVGPTPNSSYTSELHYFYRPASLTSGADSALTWLSENAPVAMLYGSLCEAYTYMKGEADMLQLYTARFTEAAASLKQLGEAKETTQEYTTGPVVRKKV